MSTHCSEWMDFMNQCNGMVRTRGKRKRFLLRDCDEQYNGRCKGCFEDDSCDLCNARLCVYLGHSINGELLCPDCWEMMGCEEDDIFKEEQ